MEKGEYWLGEGRVEWGVVCDIYLWSGGIKEEKGGRRRRKTKEPDKGHIPKFPHRPLRHRRIIALEPDNPIHLILRTIDKRDHVIEVWYGGPCCSL